MEIITKLSSQQRIMKFPSSNTSQQVIQAGSICVNAKKVYDICREFQGNNIRIRSTEQHWVHITSGASEMRLPLVEVGLYPQTELEQLSESLTLPARISSSALT